METIEKSTHQALVVPVVLLPHDNSDNLSLVKIDDYTCVTQTKQWEGKDRGVYLPPDSLVDVTMEQFSFLAKNAKYTKDSGPNGLFARIRAMNIRQRQSYGLLSICDQNIPIGTDMATEWNIGHYEPGLTGPNGKSGFITSGEVASAPVKHASLPKYDIDSGMKFARKIFIEGEPIVGTLKQHGSSSAFVYSDGEFHCRSRSEFKKEFASPPKADKDKLIAKLGESKGLEVFNKIEEKAADWKSSQNLWWRVLRENELLQKFLQDNPDTIVWGEVIGVQGVKFMYGLKPGEVSLRVFDIMKEGRWLNHQEARDFAPTLHWVRTIYEKPFNMEDCINFVENMGVYDNIGSFEEGVVISTPIERWNTYVGRSKVKLITPQYSEKS